MRKEAGQMAHTDQQVKEIEKKLNDRPRKGCNFEIPLEMINRLLFNTEVAFIT